MTTMYVQNKSPHWIFNNITPEESFIGVNPEIGHFRIFGCPVYFHVPKEKRSKLDPSGRKGTFVGYIESLKEYQIYILGQRQIEISRDVSFEEDISFQRSRESQMGIDRETMPSPPSSIQSETYIIPVELVVPVDPVVPTDQVAPIDMPIDITVGHKRHAWA
jgi:hypothetical protein